MEKYVSNSYLDTVKIAEEFSKSVNNGDIILLQGDLGAGKTAFVKAFIKALGASDDMVTSPTFTIVNEYNVNDKRVYHFDLYRINDINELYNIGIEEYLYSDAICFIEWPERAMELFNNNVVVVNILKLGETAREFIIEKGLNSWLF